MTPNGISFLLPRTFVFAFKTVKSPLKGHKKSLRLFLSLLCFNQTKEMEIMLICSEICKSRYSRYYYILEKMSSTHTVFDSILNSASIS